MTKSYIGLRGNSLSHAALWLVVCPAFVCYGYNMSVAGGLLTLPSFNEAFPLMDTINTTGAQQAYNAKIQGQCAASAAPKAASLTVAQPNRHGRCALHCRRHFWLSSVYLPG